VSVPAFAFDAPAREDLALAACHNGQLGPYAVRSGISMETRGESETYKKTEQTRTIRQIYRD
ncbi:hypothetical protein TNCV_1271171, partial [Trichonephila clavipes]